MAVNAAALKAPTAENDFRQVGMVTAGT